MKLRIRVAKRAWPYALILVLLIGCSHLRPPSREAANDYYQKSTEETATEKDSGGAELIAGLLRWLVK